MKRARLTPKMAKELLKLSSLDDRVLEGLTEQLSQLPAELYPFQTVSGVLRQSFESSGRDDLKDLDSAVVAFLYSVSSSSESLTSLFDDLRIQLAEQPDGSTAVVSKAVAFLEALGKQTQLLTSFKATALFEDNEHLLIDSKALVDIRPVFDPLSTLEVRATTLMFKVRLTYRSPGDSKNESIVLTLGDEELDSLHLQLTRAKEKARMLRDKLTNANIAVIEELSE